MKYFCMYTTVLYLLNPAKLPRNRAESLHTYCVMYLRKNCVNPRKTRVLNICVNTAYITMCMRNYDVKCQYICVNTA